MIPKQRLEDYIKMLKEARESHYELMNKNLEAKHNTGFLMEQYYAQSLTTTIEQLTEMLEETKEKTLEEVGYKLTEDGTTFARYVLEKAWYKRDGDYVVLLSRGDVSCGEEFNMTQELHAAIEQEMKKRGWWK